MIIKSLEAQRGCFLEGKHLQKVVEHRVFYEWHIFKLDVNVHFIKSCSSSNLLFHDLFVQLYALQRSNAVK